MLVEQSYINRLNEYLSPVNAKAFTRDELIYVNDGVDIDYVLKRDNENVEISVYEKGTEQTKYILVNEHLALLYYPIFVKRSFITVDFPLMPQLKTVTDIGELDNLFRQNNLADYYSIDKPLENRINLKDGQLGYIDGNGTFYNIPYIKNRLSMTFYSALLEFKKKLELIRELEEVYMVVLSDYEKTILLGFDSKNLFKV